jgi:hypothetical protein
VAAVDVIDAYLDRLPGESRRLAATEWGLTVPGEQAGGWPLHVGVRVNDGLVRAQAAALDDGSALDPWMLLWWNRQTRMARFACSRSREIWVHADAPVAGLDEEGLDRLLGLVCEGALAARDLAQAVSRSRSAR